MYVRTGMTPGRKMTEQQRPLVVLDSWHNRTKNKRLFKTNVVRKRRRRRRRKVYSELTQ